MRWPGFPSRSRWGTRAPQRLRFKSFDQNNQLSQLLCIPRAALQFVVAENCVRADIAHPSNAEHYVFSFTMEYTVCLSGRGSSRLFVTCMDGWALRRWTLCVA